MGEVPYQHQGYPAHHALVPAGVGRHVLLGLLLAERHSPGEQLRRRLNALRDRRSGNVAETVISGVIWTRFPVPQKLGYGPGAAELIMASVAVKGAVAHRIQAAELTQVPWGPTPLYLDVLAVLHGTAADHASR